MDVEEVIEALVEDVTNLKKDNKTLKRKLQVLGQAQVTAITEQQKSLLLTQRRLAKFIITSTLSENSLRSLSSNAFNQLSATASACNALVDTSDDPISHADRFYTECILTLSKSGIKTLSLK